MNIEDFLSYTNNELNVFDTSDKIWDSKEIDIDTKVDISLKLIALHPDYSIFSRIKWNYNDFSKSNKEKYWKTIIEFLKSGNSILKKGIEYSLYVDFFEDSETVEEVWEILFDCDSEDIDEVILKAAGPVPFNLKKNLYYKYIKYKNWHDLIFDSLNRSFFGPYGDLPINEGLSILTRLKVNKDESYNNLKNHLKKYNSREEYIKEINKNFN